MIYYVVLWVNANTPPSSGQDSTNVANDPRYCCIVAFRNADPTCPNNPFSTTCNAIVPPLLESELRVSGDFQVRFWFTFVLWALFIIDMIMTFLTISYMRDIEANNNDSELEDPLLSTTIESNVMNTYFGGRPLQVKLKRRK